MNREMKFRVWSKTINKMWYPKFALFESGCVYSKKEDYELLDDAMNGSATLNEDEIVMQYTGIKDKNGKEIYEGDIVKTNIDLIGIVKFDIGYYFEWITDSLVSMWNKDMKVWVEWGLEIIGNIYENPELLEVE